MKLPLFLLPFLILTASAEPLAPPVFGRQLGAIILTTAPGTHARYTIDGSNPGVKSGPYLAPIVLPIGGTIKAIAVSEDRKSFSAAAEYKVEPAINLGNSYMPSSVVSCTQDRDWPVYDWAKRHAALCEIVAKQKPRVAYIGDSITQMFGGEPHDRSEPGQPVWEKYFGPRNAVNLGFGYDYTENTLWRLEHGELDGTDLKLAIVCIGTNNAGKNTPDEIVAGIKAILAQIRRAQPNAKILLLGILPRSPKPDAIRAKVATVNTALAPLGGTGPITFLDVSEKFIQPDGSIPRELMGDFLHPTLKGYEILAAAIDPTITRLLGE